MSVLQKIYVWTNHTTTTLSFVLSPYLYSTYFLEFTTRMIKNTALFFLFAVLAFRFSLFFLFTVLPFHCSSFSLFFSLHLIVVFFRCHCFFRAVLASFFVTVLTCFFSLLFPLICHRVASHHCFLLAVLTLFSWCCPLVVAFFLFVVVLAA